MPNQQNSQPKIASGLQITECQDLAVALSGMQGVFVASTPEGGTLIIEAAEGHSIASLCLLPKPANGQTTFNFVQVSDQPQTYWQQQRQQSQR